jgi:hypothetical protein
MNAADQQSAAFSSDADYFEQFAVAAVGQKKIVIPSGVQGLDAQVIAQVSSSNRC